MKALTVYKASAGSGKTFTLATEYIKLLVKNPMSYRTILAVTFTNKATEEMKMRILSQLYGIWKQLPDSSDYMEHIVKSTGFSESQVSRQAGEALHQLLHNYSYFRVETIDTFFQSVLRNLARELDLTANLRIGLNDNQVEEQAVDQLIDSLTHTDVLLQWILKYIMETISDNHSWNIIGQVKQFGRTIFRDYYKEKSGELNKVITQKDFLPNYMSQLRQIRSDALQHMKEIGDHFFDVLASEGLSETDLSYGKTGVASFFRKLQNGQFDEGIIGSRVIDCKDDASKWCPKKSSRAEFIQSLADSTLMPILEQAIAEQPLQWKLYKSSDLTLRHLNQLRLLDSIEQKVRMMNDEANRFLLSDTQQLLHSLIKDSDSPFIFEKKVLDRAIEKDQRNLFPIQVRIILYICPVVTYAYQDPVHAIIRQQAETAFLPCGVLIGKGDDCTISILLEKRLRLCNETAVESRLQFRDQYPDGHRFPFPEIDGKLVPLIPHTGSCFNHPVDRLLTYIEIVSGERPGDRRFGKTEFLCYILDCYIHGRMKLQQR